ncbi:unnamed protein product [Lactuca saligna]|uniref:Uncharacterized protein n=1 Tax=Lactuca saligna TaxID=75948 RepID=A0AA36E323_LACSI|nr:unnamed protein product [Lactuca saligna]
MKGPLDVAQIWTISDGPCSSNLQKGPLDVAVLKHYTNDKRKDVTTLDWNTFQNKQLAHVVNVRTLDNLITKLLLWLLDKRVPRMDDGSQLLNALNVLMLKIVDNSERTSSFMVLISLLKPLDTSRWPAPPSNESFATRNSKFSELVVKCLIKLTKVLQNMTYEVDLDRILQSIHVYLQDLGMEEIRGGADDKPLRMVKTVLHELVKLRGTAIKGHLSMVPIDMELQPIILAYINHNLQTLAATRMLTPVGQTRWGDSMANYLMPAMHSADAQLKQELSAIFKKIGDNQTCSIGLYELYRITQLYPQDLDAFTAAIVVSIAFSFIPALLVVAIMKTRLRAMVARDKFRRRRNKAATIVQVDLE